MTQGFIESSGEEINKKLTTETARYFPSRPKSSQWNNLERYKAYLLAKASFIDNPSEHHRQAMMSTLKMMLAANGVPCFRADSTDHIITQMEKSYAALLFTLSECGCPNPAELTAFEQLTWREILDKRYEEQKKALENAK